MTLEELFERYHVGLFRFISRMTGDSEFAMDILQETFLHVATKPLPPDKPPKACLFQVARGLAQSGMRKQHRRRNLLNGRARSVPGPAPTPAPDAEVERSEVRTLVRNALMQLNTKERTILLMHEEGFSHREIASTVSTTTKSVGTMYARALAKLEERLGDIWREEL